MHGLFDATVDFGLDFEADPAQTEPRPGRRCKFRARMGKTEPNLGLDFRAVPG